MQNVLYISYDGMTDPLGQSQVIPYLQGLAALGYTFTILSAEKKERFEKKKNEIASILHDSGIAWKPVIYTKSPPVLSTLYDYYRMRGIAAELHRTTNFQVVHCRSYISSLIGSWMKKKYGTRFIFDMRGFWADERVDGGLWKLDHPVYKSVYRFFKKKERSFLTASDHVVSLTERAKQEMLRWGIETLSTQKITVIPCCTDTQLFDPSHVDRSKQDQLRRQFGDGFILSYLGSIGTWYMLDEMLDFFVALKKEIPSARFLFITHDEHDRIRGKALEKGIGVEDLIICPAERKDVPVVLSVSDWSLFFIRTTFSKMASCPTKQGEIMAMGIPVVCNAGVGDTDGIVQKYASGVVVEDNRYADAILKIKQGWGDPHKIRSGAVDYFSLEKGVASYAALYNAIK